jgi:hypothetical protein
MLALQHESSQRRRWGRIVARAWDDDGFRRRLLNEPASVLIEEGMDLPPGVAVKVIEGNNPDTTDEHCFRLPPRPAASDLVHDNLGLPPVIFNGTTSRFSHFTRPA